MISKSSFSRRYASALMVLAISTALVAVAAPAQAARRCGGKRATIVGTNGDNTLNGTKRADVIVGLGGVDRINGNGGNDIICGGPGGDFIYGGNGSDRLLGQGGDDVLIGKDLNKSDSGNDALVGGRGTVDIAFFGFAGRGVTANLSTGRATGEGSDRLAGIEAIYGSPHGDRFTGNGRANTLFGAGGNDTLVGGKGVDGLDGGMGDDTLDGGDDLDLVFFNSENTPVIADLSINTVTGQGVDTLANFEVVVGSTGADTMIGDESPNYFLPEGGDDTIRGGSGFDMLMFFDSPTAVDIDLTAGRGEASGNQTYESIEGVWGSPQADRLVGSTVNELFLGDNGDDVIDGRAGDDMVSGGNGNDDLDGGQGSRDLVDYELALAGVAVDLQAGEATGGEGTDSLANFEEIFGSFFDDTLGGDHMTNNIWGWNGADVLRGFGGNDNLVGGGIDGATDGSVDQIDGGDGLDQCGADLTDPQAHCEGAGIPPIHPLADDAAAASRVRRNH